ncbi:tyrosine-type recombinase/integrase [Sphaerisporangium sp. NPDC051011]|uniref:tyrosine-type recombinase/integrase n=1 Tax=Sphaerisporangium sp. NPDC051011 TaxID=3155792 RepID=UPI003407CABE
MGITSGGAGRYPQDRSDEELRPIRLHDLRHTAASLLKKLGVAPRDAMEILGHSRISVTMEIYTHGDEESRESAIRKVNDLFQGPLQ